MFIQLRSSSSILPLSKSIYNNNFISIILKTAYKLLKDSRFKGLQVTIILLYTAQVATYSYTTSYFVNFLLTYNKDTKEYLIGLQLKDINVFIVNKMQGAQKDTILYYSITLDKLRFTAYITY